MQNFFDKKRPIGLERSNYLNRFFWRALDKPTRIDQQIVLISDRRARGFHKLYIVGWIFPENTPAELDRRESFVQIDTGGLAHRFRSGPEQSARVSTHSIPPTGTQQDANRLPVKFPCNG